MYTHTQEEIKEVLHRVIGRIQEGRYLDEHDEDIPITESDVQDVEDDDYVEEEDIKPRERALPSYIKKEKGPLISSESEDEEEEEEVEEEGPQITADDYLEDFPEEDIRVIEALFAEDDEVVRKTTKRKAPKVRNISESSDEEEDEDGEKEEKKTNKAAGRPKKSDVSPAGKKREDGRTKAAKAKEAEKKKKLQEKETAKQEMAKRQKEKEEQKKRKREGASHIKRE